MSSKKAKLLESAQKNFLKGLYDKSIQEYRLIIQLDPADIRHRQRLAEILTKANKKDDAINEYTSLAKYYTESVHYLKAIAVYKQIQKLDPSNPDISLTLASLNEKQGLIGNATSEYAAAIRIYEANGDNLKALKALESMTALDPGNYAVRLRVAEKYFSVGREEKAADDFVALAMELQERNDENGFIHVSDKINQLFSKQAPDLFARINAGSTVEEQIAEELEAPDQQQEMNPVTNEDVQVPTEAPLLESEDFTVGNSEEFVRFDEMPPADEYEELEELEEIEELEEVESPACVAEDSDWEEEIDLEAIASISAFSGEQISAADDDSTNDPSCEISQQDASELDDYELEDLELDDIELALEIDDEQPENASVADDCQFPDSQLTGSNGSFDLGKELSIFADDIDFDLIRSDKGDNRFDLDSPSGFKRNELENEDTESHYSLGLAYKEMGLFDEAITEFLVAAHSPERKIDCMILLAVCLREINEIDKAVGFLTETLKEPQLNEDETLGIKYELALCHEAVAETVQAKQLYTEILSSRPDFSDAADRLSRL